MSIMSEVKGLKVGQGVSIFDGNTWCYCIADTDEFIASLKNGELILGDVWELGLHKSLIPECYAIVPIEPTNEMLERVGCMNDYYGDTDQSDQDHIEWYKAMIEAAQK